jgi:hypothetical protein
MTPPADRDEIARALARPYSIVSAAYTTPTTRLSSTEVVSPALIDGAACRVSGHPALGTHAARRFTAPAVEGFVASGVRGTRRSVGAHLGRDR